MARIRRAVLGLLNTLYGFPGGEPTAPREIDVRLPVTPVHDVSREAELATGMGFFNGYYTVYCAQAHVAAGLVEDTIDFPPTAPNVALAGFNFNPDTQWIWLVDAWGTIDVGTNFDEAWVAINHDPDEVGVTDGGAATGVQQIVMRFDASIPGSVPRYLERDARGAAPLPARIPSLDGTGEIIVGSRSTGVAAFTALWNILVWVGDRGCWPPGLS